LLSLKPVDFIIQTFSVKPAPDVDMGLQLSKELSFTIEGKKERQKLTLEEIDEYRLDFLNLALRMRGVSHYVNELKETISKVQKLNRVYLQEQRILVFNTQKKNQRKKILQVIRRISALSASRPT
jgi:hypothetical protein